MTSKKLPLYNKVHLNKEFNSNSKIVKPSLNRGQWSEEENKLLRNWVSTNGPCKWNKCSLFINGRNAKQCREHWYDFLDPNLTKGNWTLEEDLLIMIFYKKYNGSWKNIIPIFENRSENSIKNRFYSELRKIASQYEINSNRDSKQKLKLNIILKYLDEGIKEAKNNFLKKSNMNEKKLNEYINKIDELIKHLQKGNKHIDLNSIKEKEGINIINLIEDNEEKIIKKSKRKVSKRKKNKKLKVKENDEKTSSLENKKTFEIIIDNKNFEEDDKTDNKILNSEIPLEKEDKKEENKIKENLNNNNLGLNQEYFNNEIKDNNNEYNINQKFIQKNNYNSFKAKPYDKKYDYKRKDTFDELDNNLDTKEEKNTSNINMSNLNNLPINEGSMGIQKDIYNGHIIIPFPSFDKSGNLIINSYSNNNVFKNKKIDEKMKNSSNLSKEYNNILLKNLNVSYDISGIPFFTFIPKK